MRIVKISLKIITLSFIIFFSCEKLQYAPMKENVVNINEPKSEISIDLFNQKDTIEVWGNVNFQFNVDLKNTSLKEIKVFVDSSLYFSTSQANYLNINSNQLSNGPHQLNLEIWVYSNSGSLADKIGKEILQSNRNYTLIVDNSYPDSAFILNEFKIDNGKLKLNWNKYNSFNFQEYQIYQIVIENGYMNEYLRHTILNSSDTSWADDIYAGGKTAFRVNLKAADRIIKGKAKVYEHPVPTILNFGLTSDNKSIITWSKCKFYSSFEKYIIHKCIGDSTNGFEEIGEITNVTDTNFVDSDFRFGDNIYYRIETKPTYRVDLISNWKLTYLGETCPYHNSAEYIPNNNSIYLNSYHYNHRLDATTCELLSTGNGKLDISFDGTRAFAKNGTSPYIAELDPFSLDTISTFSTQPIIGYLSYMGEYALLKNARIAYSGFTYSSPTFYTDKIFLIDLDNSLKIDELQISGSRNVSKCTFDGRYLLIGYRIYDLNNNNFNLIGQIDHLSQFCFLEDNIHFVYTNSSQISKYTCNDLNFVSEFTIDTDLYYPMIDPQTGYIGGINYERTRYYIYNLLNGLKIADIPIMNQSEYSLANSTLFASKGFYLKLNL